MKTVQEIINAIKYNIEQITREYSSEVGSEFSCEVLPERDYTQKTENNRDEIEERSIYDVVDRNRIYFVIKLGRGEYNFAVSSIPLSIEVVSEENSMDASQTILRRFVEKVNYKYADGIIQTYFLPSVVNPSNEVRSGFRALIELQGRLYSFEDLVSVVTKLEIDNVEIPFIRIGFGWSAQPNPQAFPSFLPTTNKNGATYNINRQHTKTFSISTYLWNTTGVSDVEGFSKKIFETINEDMNKKYHITMYTNNGEKVTDAYYTLVNFGYDQQLGTPNMANLSFSESEGV